MKDFVRKQFRRETVYLSYNSRSHSITGAKSGQELRKQRQEMCVYLNSAGFLYSYTAQGPKPRMKPHTMDLPISTKIIKTTPADMHPGQAGLHSSSMTLPTRFCFVPTW